MTQKWSISVLCYALLVGYGGSSLNNSTACDSERCFMLVAEIGPMISKHEQVKPTAEILKNMNELCVDIKKCFKAAKCKKGAHTYESMRDACEHLELMTGNVQPCMKKFYSAVYNNKYDCTKTWNYLTENLPKRREAYTSGRFCFFEVVGKECSQETVGILSSNFNYDNLIDVLATVPGGFADNCNRLHHSFNKLQCEALELDITAKEKEITRVEGPTNDTSRTEFLQLLRDAESCITKSCSYSNLDVQAFKSKKERLELQAS